MPYGELYGDLSYFMPGKSYFKEPGQYEAALKAEATKKASFLSDITKFYKGLEESARQFDINIDLQNKALQQRATEFAHTEKYDWAKLGASLVGTGVGAYLQNKDIEFQFDWLDNIMEQLDITEPATSAIADTSLAEYLNEVPTAGWLDTLDYEYLP